MSHDLVVAVPLIAAILLHVVTYGYWAARGIGFNSQDFWTKVAVVGGLGYPLLGGEMFLLGHVNGLHRGVIYCSTAIVAVAFLLAWRKWVSYFQEFKDNLRGLFVESPVIAISVIAMVCVMLFSATRPSMIQFDDDYHYGAPLLWAARGQWAHSPFRMMDAAAMMEMLYTIGAIFKCSTAGHWVHVSLVLFMFAALAGIAKATGGNRPAYIAAVIACPILAYEASAMVSDLAVAAFCIIAFAALFQGSRGLGKNGGPSNQTVLAAGLIFVGAFSAKNLGSLPAFVGALAYAASPRLDWKAIFRTDFKGTLVRVALMVVPAVLVIGIWIVHCYYLSGHLWDSRGLMFVSDPNDWRWTTGSAVGRIPRLVDWLMIPFVPFYVSIFGSKEPYGGRTGLLLTVFVWVGISALKSLTREQRLHARWMLGAGLFYYLLLAPIIVKTRLLMFSWAAMSALVAIAYKALEKRTESRLARVGIIVFTLLLWIGLLDGAHHLLFGLILPIPTANR